MIELPALLARIAGIAGVAAAIAIARAKGGTKAYFPVRPPAGHWIVNAVGQSAAEAICRELVAGSTGDWIEVPYGPTGSWAEIRRRVVQLDAAGHSAPSIARACGITDRSVRRSRARRRADPRQGMLDLADDDEIR
jgi:hypothetical protein